VLGLIDVYIFPCVLKTCGGVSDLVKGREIHYHVLRFGFCRIIEHPAEPDLITLTIVIDYCL
jgi:hypothetical protein